MNRLYKTFAILLLVLGGNSCDLETTVYQDLPVDQFPENEAQLESILLGAYSENVDLLDDWGWWLYNQEVSSDVLVFPQRGTDWEDGGKWRVLNRHTWTADDAPIEGMWRHLFYGVTACNQAIEYFAADSEAARKAKAEMEVLRSYYYYLLIDNFGAVPYQESFSDADVAPYRNDRGDITERLITVVTDALPLIPNVDEVSTQRISKPMAYMLLGKLYLNAHIYKGASAVDVADMDSVAHYMNMVIDAGYSLEDDRLAPFAVQNSASTENIFTILGDETSDSGLRLSFRTLHTLHQQTYDLAATPWNGCAAKPDFYTKLFAANDGFDDADDITSVNDEIVDKRAAAFLRGQQYDIDGEELADDNGNLILTNAIKADIMDDGSDGGAVTRFSGYRVVKYEVGIGSGLGDKVMENDFPVYRLADAYLMRAEATLRGATISNATADEDLNVIRNKAGLPNVTATEQEILDERGREMYLEGHRRSDLIRFGKFADRDWWLGATDSDNGEHRLVFPVPQQQIDANPNLSEAPMPLAL